MEEDRFKIGIIAGSIGTVWMGVSITVAKLLGAKHTYLDYASIVTFNHIAKGWGYINSIVTQIFMNLALAIIFSYIASYLPTKLYKTQGVIFGSLVWFVITGILFLFRPDFVSKHSPFGAGYEAIQSIIFGIIIAEVIHRLKFKW
jgi:hypothetical protein